MIKVPLTQRATIISVCPLVSAAWVFLSAPSGFAADEEPTEGWLVAVGAANHTHHMAGLESIQFNDWFSGERLHLDLDSLNNDRLFNPGLRVAVGLDYARDTALYVEFMGNSLDDETEFSRSMVSVGADILFFHHHWHRLGLGVRLGWVEIRMPVGRTELAQSDAQGELVDDPDGVFQLGDSLTMGASGVGALAGLYWDFEILSALSLRFEGGAAVNMFETWTVNSGRLDEIDLNTTDAPGPALYFNGYWGLSTVVRL